MENRKQPGQENQGRDHARENGPVDEKAGKVHGVLKFQQEDMKPMKDMKRLICRFQPAGKLSGWNQGTIRVTETETCLVPFMFLIPFTFSC
jgi:hypothetical protein